MADGNEGNLTLAMTKEECKVLKQISLDQKTPADHTNPEISIIVPVYHVEKYLRRALDSLLRQTFSDFELILVNDGGNDEETAICKEYAEKDHRIVYLVQTNQGLSAARNRGLDVHRGHWILFVDSDDWVRDDYCERALFSVRAANTEMGIFDLVYTEGDQTEGTLHRVDLPEGIYDSDSILAARVCGKVQCYAWNKIYREDLWDGIRFPVGELWEDDAVIHEIIDKANTIAVIHDILYYKPGREDCITAEATRNKTAAYWLYIQRRRRWEYLKQHHPEMLSLAADDMIGTIIKYARTCLLFTRDAKGYENACHWAKASGIPLKEVSLQKRIRYAFLLRSKPVSGILERMVLFLTDRK